jgi:hypothetical protein
MRYNNQNQGEQELNENESEDDGLEPIEIDKPFNIDKHDNKETALDEIERRFDNQGSHRPLREGLEDVLERIPEGPGKKLGEGDMLGAAGYFAISTGQTAVIPIPGVRQPGYSVISHGSEVMETKVRHTVRITAASKNVAKFASEYEVSAPSNLDYSTGEVVTVSIEEVKPRPTYSTWEVVVDVADRGQKEV